MAKYLDFRHKERAPKLSRALQHRPDRPGADGAFHSIPETKERTLGALLWGLVPHWANDLTLGSRMINARAETVVTIPAFLQKPALHHSSERFL